MFVYVVTKHNPTIRLITELYFAKNCVCLDMFEFKFCPNICNILFCSSLVYVCIAK